MDNHVAGKRNQLKQDADHSDLYRIDYEELCRLDVLGLEDTDENDRSKVYAEFREQLSGDPAAWLVWNRFALEG